MPFSHYLIRNYKKIQRSGGKVDIFETLFRTGENGFHCVSHTPRLIQYSPLTDGRGCPPHDLPLGQLSIWKNYVPEPFPKPVSGISGSVSRFLKFACGFKVVFLNTVHGRNNKAIVA